MWFNTVVDVEIASVELYHSTYIIVPIKTFYYQNQQTYF